MHVLVTGAAGRIGSDFVAACEDRGWHLRLADRRAAPQGSSESVELDITDLASARAACAGVDAVLHLAADPSPDADFRSSVLPVNIAGTYNVLEAAVGAGVRRFVFASSIHAVDGYPDDHGIRETDAPWPVDDYGVGKAFGEALCAKAATCHPITCVSVRIGYYGPGLPPDAPAPAKRIWLSPRDGTDLLERALTAPIDGHAVVHGVSDNREKRLLLDRTRAVLGYAPVDDAFA